MFTSIFGMSYGLMTDLGLLKMYLNLSKILYTLTIPLI